MKTQHTPGPWIVTDSETAKAIPHRWIADAGAGNHVVIQESGKIAHREQADANARLIAAAPDLLEACTKALTRNGVNGDSELVRIIEAAIAKATGGQV